MRMMHICRSFILLLAIAFPASSHAQTAWWEQPHHDWHVKDDWKAAPVNGYSHVITLKSPARSGWIVIWGKQGVELSVNEHPILRSSDPALVHDTDLSPLIQGARAVRFQAGPDRIVAEGEIMDDQGRIYPFASGCMWPTPASPGTPLPPAANAHRPGLSDGNGFPAAYGRLLRYNAEERGKSDISQTLGRIQRLREQSMFLLRRFRHPADILSFDPDTLWRRAEQYAVHPAAEAERILVDQAIPAQKRGLYEHAIDLAGRAGRKLAAAELAIRSAQAVYELERQLAHLEACLHIIQDAGLSAPPLDSHFAEIRALVDAARFLAQGDDWAGVDKQNRFAQLRLDALEQRLTRLWGRSVGGLDQFPEDRLGWLNHPSLMGNDPSRWAFSMLPSERHPDNPTDFNPVTTPGPMSWTTEFAIPDGDRTERLVFFSSAMSPGVLVASDQPTIRLHGWETRGHAPPESISFSVSNRFHTVLLDEPGFSLDGSELSAGWLYLGPGTGSTGSGLNNTRPTLLVIEQRPHNISWNHDSFGRPELAIAFEQSAGRVMIFTPPFEDPLWTHQDVFVRAQTLRSVPIACSQLVRVHPDRGTADHLLRYHHLELDDFAGHGALQIAPVPMLVAYAFEHEFPGLSSRGFSTTTYRGDHANYRLRLHWDSFDYTVPFLDRSAHETPLPELAESRWRMLEGDMTDSRIAWFHFLEPVDATHGSSAFQQVAWLPSPHRDLYYPGYQVNPESLIDSLLDPILYTIRNHLPLRCLAFGISPFAPGGDHLRQLEDQLALFHRFGIQWTESAWRGRDTPHADLAPGNRRPGVSPALSIRRHWLDQHHAPVP